MTIRAVTLRTLAVLGVGAAVLATILYYASTVDGRPPTVLRILVTRHLTGDVQAAVTTTSIEVDFSEAVDHASAQAAFSLSPDVSGSFSWTGASLTFTPAERLPLRTSFVVSIGPGARDRVGNAMAAGFAPFRFTTVGNPGVVASVPVDGAVGVLLDAPITIAFSTQMDTRSVDGALQLDPAAEVRLRWSREQLTVVPVSPLEPNRIYTLIIGIEARDHAGTPLSRPFELSFRTVTSALSARGRVPAADVAGVSVSTPIAIIFDRPLDPGSVHGDLLTITPAVAGSLDAIAAPGAAGMPDSAIRMLRFQPSGPLAPDTTYEVTLAVGLRGADGIGMAAPLSWSFTTGSPTTTLSNQVVFLSDRAGMTALWAMNPDGTNQRQLSAELSPAIDYAIAPDGSALVVADGASIVWQRADGSERRLLTDAGAVEFDPAFSADGATITFGRADPALGTGLGLWMRDADGTNPRAIQLPSGALPSAGSQAQVALLRVPRLSPDGTAVAYVDGEGFVAILDLGPSKLWKAPFVAAGEPVWLPDSRGVIVTGIPSGSGSRLHPYSAHTPLPRLDPASLDPTAPVTALRIVRLDRGSTSVTYPPFGAAAAEPAFGARGRIAHLRLVEGSPGAGSLWLMDGINVEGSEVLPELGTRVRSASFTPESDALLISVEAATGDRSTVDVGIWLVELGSGAVRQLSPDGWLPRWLP